MDGASAIPCVIYAAKSTEDKRGSIPEQLCECREAVDADPRRRLFAEYEDEAFSAYRCDRGPGLRDATEHAEDLAAEHGVAELWAQHSDRIARGDGRAARHTVEIALWALKHDVRVRTLQDPDTFRDLLYAVVTGQRNNEDSKRKAIATQAGRKRAIARGEFVSHLPDGYRLHAYLDEHEQLRKQMVPDLERQPLFELLFRLALRGRSCGQIAKTLNDRGWLTKPVRRIDRPRPFDVTKVYELLRNPRYAALGTYSGEVFSRGHWHAYITEGQHEQIKARLANPRGRREHGPLEAYLLKGLARCGRCGSTLRVHTGRSRADGTRPRAYVCASHRAYRGTAQCDATPSDAHVIEAMVISSLPALLDLDGETPAHVAPVRSCPATDAPIGAEGGGGSCDSPYAALAQHTARSQRRARELADTERLRRWLDREAIGRSQSTRAETHELRRLLLSWFSEISIEVSDSSVSIQTKRRHRSPSDVFSAAVSIERTVWSRHAPAGHRQLAHQNAWAEAEMIGALQAWADEHDCSPRRVEWELASPEHPSALTVCKHFGQWKHALSKAGLQAVAHTRRRTWTAPEILEALKAWTRKHGAAPRSMQWAHAPAGYPSAATVRKHFGHFVDALCAAGLAPDPKRGYRLRYWQEEEIVQNLRAWYEQHGRAPVAFEWITAGASHPCSSTVRNHFGTWAEALLAAGL